MLGHRIKPKMRAGPARAKALALYAKGRSANKQMQLVRKEISTIKRHIVELQMSGKPEPDDLKNANEYLDVLQRSLRSIERANGVDSANILAGRGAALAEYATRMDEQLEIESVIVGGLRGISTGETFYSGVLSAHTADSEFENFSRQTKRGGHPIEHIVYSWPKDENPNNETAIAAANFALQKAGFPDACPRMIGVHRDTDNLHVHVVLSRYMPHNDKVWSCKSLIDKIHFGCRAAELEYGFKHENGNCVVRDIDGEKQIVAQTFKFSNLSDAARTVENRHGEISFERFVRDHRPLIEALLADSKNWEVLHRRLADSLGIGIKRHGKGYVITDLSGAKDIHTKASFGGLGAPTVEARFGAWKPTQSMPALRRRACACKYSYTMTVAPKNIAAATPVAAINKSIQPDMKKQKQQAIERLQSEFIVSSARVVAKYETQLATAKTPDEKRIATTKKREDLQKIKADHKIKKQNIRDEFAPIRERTAVEKKQRGSVPRDRASDNAVSSHVMRIHAIVLIVRLPGYQAREAIGGGIEYMAGGVRVLHDDGRRIEISSNIKNHIRDGIELLLRRDPDARERGITITGTDEFKRQTLKVLAEMGLKPTYAGKAAKAAFELFVVEVETQAKARQALRAAAELATIEGGEGEQQEAEKAEPQSASGEVVVDTPEDDIDLSEMEEWDGNFESYRKPEIEQNEEPKRPISGPRNGR